MRCQSKSTLRIAVLVTAGFCLVSLASAATQLKSQLSPLAYFLGQWDCSGKFDSSGKTIDAQQHFESDLDGSWILFRHDDKPPFGYHSLSEWGWDSGTKMFVMIAQDSTGGVRLFRSHGWDSMLLQWDGDSFDAVVPTQRFTFEKVDEHHFKVSYFTLKNADWSRVDSSTCSKQ